MAWKSQDSCGFLFNWYLKFIRRKIENLFNYFKDNWEVDDKLEVYFNENLLETINFVSSTDGVSNYCGWSHINDLRVEKFWEFNNN
jgi:hypothetical protein